MSLHMKAVPVKSLERAYDGVLTIVQADRIAAFNAIFSWYDSNLPVLAQQKMLTPDLHKTLDRAVKSRKLGSGASIGHEIEAGFRMATRLYETVFAKMQPPSIEETYKQYEATKDQLMAKAQALDTRFDFVLSMFKNATGTPLTFKVAKQAAKPVQFNPVTSELTLVKEKAEQMLETLKREGLLTLVASELKFLCRAESMIQVNGQWQLDSDKFVNLMPTRLAAVATYCRTNADANRYLVRNKPAPVATATVPGQPKAPRQSAGGQPKVGGHFRSGTAVAIAYQRMEDGNWHERATVIAGLPSKNPGYAVEALIKDGPKLGINIAVQGTKVKMTVTQP